MKINKAHKSSFEKEKYPEGFFIFNEEREHRISPEEYLGSGRRIVHAV